MGEPLRVLNLFTTMGFGGAETLVMNYYRNIDRTKVQFDFMVHRYERAPYDDEIEDLGGKIYRMPPISPGNFYRYKKELRDFFIEHDEYKIIHSHMSELGYYAFKEASKYGRRTLICHAHNVARAHDLKRIMREYYKRRIRKYTTDNFVCSQKAGEWLFGKRSKNSFVMMNNAIESERFIFSKEIRTQVRAEMGFSEDDLIIGNVGRFAFQKNQEFLLKVFHEVIKRRKAKLLLVGQGGFEQTLRAQAHDLGISDYVIFAGVRRDVNRLYQAMDVFVFPSRYEGFGNVILEAQAAGLNCIVSEAIPKEAQITDLVSKLSLTASPQVWAETVMSKFPYTRKNMKAEIENAGFDIKNNAMWLENFYQDSYRRNVDVIENIHAVERR